MGFMSGGMVADSVSEGFCNYLKRNSATRLKDDEAFFADNGHAGMIKKGYVDPYFPQKAKGRIWRIK